MRASNNLDRRNIALASIAIGGLTATYELLSAGQYNPFVDGELMMCAGLYIGLQI